jgi:hypothetical protein
VFMTWTAGGTVELPALVFDSRLFDTLLWCTVMCLSTLLCLSKLWLHTGHEYCCLWPSCIRKCTKQFDWFVNVLLQTAQRNGRSPVCRRTCTL